MIASVLIEYSVKSLDKTFDYLVPDSLVNEIKVGQKVLVPFGVKEVEGFVIELKNEKKDNLEYKYIIDIVEKDFCLNEELIELGKYIKETTLSTLISAYQSMFPKALKASNKTNIGLKTKSLVYLNNEVDVDKFIESNKRKKRQVEIVKLLREKKEIERKEINSTSLRELIESNIVLVKEVEELRKIDYIESKKENIILTESQKECLNEIKNSTNNKVLLYGVTGSGKTEIYINLIKSYLENNKSIIMLVPEISLAPQIVSKFKTEFGSSVAVLHSALSEGEKYDEYRRIVRGEVNIVVGARSAVFAPIKNIGLIIIDECGSPSFKQDVNPKYNAIDIAFKRAEYNNALVLMGSATPLLEQFARGEKGVFKLVKLTERVSKKLPFIKTIDMNEEVKKRNFIISSELKEKINDRLNKHEQVILLLNRRGYSTFMSCSSCGYVWKCPNCDISLIYHKTSNNLRCHYCGYNTTMSKVCPSCKEEAVKDLGMGTEKLESIVKEMFPNSKIIRMDLDTTYKKGSHQKIIESFKNHEYDILIGTQMISKGLNFRDVSLVGVINADASLNIPDFRSGERTFELLMQTSGRCGRYELDGEVLIQTFNKDNYVFDSLKKQDYVDFYKKEMKIRKELKYPPYYYMVSIKIVSNNYEMARDEINKVKKYLDKNLSNNFIVLGPSTASIFKLKNNYYFQILIKYKKEENLMSVLGELNDLYTSDKVKLDININPLNLI